MKKYLLKSTIIFSALFFWSGCYTVIWMPEDEFPSETVYEGYYPEMYYGDYYSFYNYPWWSGFTPSTTPNGSDYVRSENATITSLRNEGQGRGKDDGRKILHTDPPRRDVSNDNSSSSYTSSNNSWSNHSSSESSNNSSSTRNSDNSSMRNDTGNRNSNSGRR